jgi:hypothetical protein
MKMATAQDMKTAGFQGFYPVSQLQNTKCEGLPKLPGVYAVLRPQGGRPTFLKQSVGGHFKGKDPTISEELLKILWVSDSVVLYIGRAGGPDSTATLKTRISDFVRFGAGKPVGHYGGRVIWQLEDHADLIICWKPTSVDPPAKMETQLISLFQGSFGKRPFANLRD